MRGTRHTDGRGSAPIEDPAEAAALRRQARGVWIRVLLTTAVGMAVILLLPG